MLTMQPVTPSALDITRYKLKQLAHWIRDDLDLLVARDGPDILRPDDVLTLHELFVTLRHSTTITALDLRATGIHKAVKDVAGIATRWPGRLCDDCDKIITVWTNKFGRFDELHPFLYGRGGRLEGITSMTEYSREALLKRWSETCPEKIHPKVSHRHGTLGFKAGDWWINALFAHYAGIIGLESVEGGTTYDKNGAYALVLKDTGEINAQSDELFTYRCPLNDKGKFRLTAATLSSREPIRVLRSHNVSSIWGPKAGIRYEGLYSVRGWCVRQARLKDTFTGAWKEGDVLYEVVLRRRDEIPLDKVSKRPTNIEVDDYVEYKRLRKLYHEQRRRGPGPLPMPPKAAPPVPPLQLPARLTKAPHSLLRVSPNLSRQNTFKEPAFDAPRASKESDWLSGADVVSPMTVPGAQEPFFAVMDSNTLAIHSDYREKNTSLATPTGNDPRERQVHVAGPGANSPTSSTRSNQSELKKVVPWLELEAELPTPPHINALPTGAVHNIAQATERLEAKAAEMNPVKKVRRQARDTRHPSRWSLRGQDTHDEDATNLRNLNIYSSRPMLGRKKEKKTEVERQGKKIFFGKKPKCFDGAGYSADEDADSRSTPLAANPCPIRSSSTASMPRLHSPTPIKPPKPATLLTFHHDVEHIEFSSPFDSRLSFTTTATVVSTPTSPMGRGAGCGDGRVGGESVALSRLRRWMSR